jgi:WD40 repeat protein
MAIRLWEVRTGKELFFTKVEGTFETFVKKSAVFSPDRKTLALCSAEKTLRLLDVGTGKELRKLPGQVSSIQFSPDGKRLATSAGGSVILWDMATGKELGWRKWRGQEIQALQFNGDRLLVTTEEKARERSPTTRLWDFAESRRLIERPQFLPGPVSPDGTMLVALTGYGPCVGAFLQLWDLKTATEGAMVGLPTLTGPPPVFTANGKILLVVWSPPRKGPFDNPQAQADLFAVPSGAHLRRITLPSGINSAVIAPDGQTVAAVGDKQCLVQRLALVWVRVVPDPPGFLSPNGGLLARTDTSGKVQLLDRTTGQALHVLDDLKGAIKAIAFSPGGEYLAAASEGKVCLWTTGRGRLRQSWTGLKGPIERLDFGPDGNTLEAGTSAKLIRWNLRTGKEIGEQSR